MNMPKFRKIHLYCICINKFAPKFPKMVALQRLLKLVVRRLTLFGVTYPIESPVSVTKSLFSKGMQKNSERSVQSSRFRGVNPNFSKMVELQGTQNRKMVVLPRPKFTSKGLFHRILLHLRRLDQFLASDRCNASYLTITYNNCWIFDTFEKSWKIKNFRKFFELVEISKCYKSLHF